MPTQTAETASDLIQPIEVAHFFLAFAEDCGDVVTHLKLQKLVYYAQAWYLANTGVPLFAEDFQAWVHGPVLRSLYDSCNGAYPSTEITTKASLSEIKEKIGEDLYGFLELIGDRYMSYTGYQLEVLTHQEEPWIEARAGLRPGENSERHISKKTMQEFYSAMLA